MAVRYGTNGLATLLRVLSGADRRIGASVGPEPTDTGAPPAGRSSEAVPPGDAIRRTNGHATHDVPRADSALEQTAEALASAAIDDLIRDRPEIRAGLTIWALMRPLGVAIDPAEPTEQSRALFDEWLLGAVAEQTLGDMGIDAGAAMVGVGLARVLLAHERALAETGALGPRRVLERLLRDGDVRDFLGINRYRDVLWFSQERFDALVAGLLATAATVLTAPVVEIAAPTGAGSECGSVVGAEPASATSSSGTTSPSGATPPAEPTPTEPTPKAAPSPAAQLRKAVAIAQAFRDAESASNFQLERLLNLLPISPPR